MIRKKLRAARLARRLTQRQLAKKLKVSRVTVNYWEKGMMTPGLYNQEVIKTAFGITDDKILEDLLSLEEETNESREASAEVSLEEDKGLVSASPEEELHESIMADPEALSEEATSSDQSLHACPVLAHALSSSNLWQPYAPTLRDFIVSDPSRHFWQIAHTDYSTSDEMIAEIQTAIKELNMTMGDKITRRDALCELASIPMITLGKTYTLHSRRYEELLRYCTAALEACWELYRDSDPIGTKYAFDCVCTYVPILETIAHDSAEYRKEALDLAAQYALLQTLLSWGRAKPMDCVGYAQNAQSLSEATGNILFQLSASPKLSYTYLIGRQPARAWETMQKGEHVLKEYQRMKNRPPIPAGVIGNFYSSYSQAQVDNGISPDTALGMATDSEPLKEHIALVEFTASAQWWEAAYACCAKNDPAQAMMWLEKLIDPETLAPRQSVPQSENERIGAINRMARALLLSIERDMYRIIRVWKAGMKGAKALKNEIRYQEAITNFEIMRAFWPGEQAIMKLLPLAEHWSEEEEQGA